MAKKEKEVVEEFRYSSGCDLIDLCVGGDKGVLGFQGGKWVNLIGDASSGKSLLCLETITANKYKYKDKARHIYDDSENGFTFDTEERYGFSSKEKGYTDSETVEQMNYQHTKFMESLQEDEHGIYIVDSLDGLADKMGIEMDEDTQKAIAKGKENDAGSYQMSIPKYLSQTYFKMRHGALDDTKSLCIITSQVRENVGAGLYGAKLKRGCGKALDLYANYIIWLKTMCFIEKNGRKVGAVVHAKVTKAKVKRPYREVIYTVIFDYGIDNVSSNLDFLFDLRSSKNGELLKRAESIVWEEGIEPMTKDELVEYIEKNKLKKELKRRTMEKWETIEDSIASNRPNKYEDEDDE